MANIHRQRWDFKANPASIKEYPVDAAVEIEIGDLCWLNVDDARPASHSSLWQSVPAGFSSPGSSGVSAADSERATRRRLSERFLGFAVSAKAGTSATGSVRIAGRGTYALPVGTATTFEIGDLIGGDKASGNTLLAQSVEKVTEPSEAIGRAVKRYTANVSLVEFEIEGRAEHGGYPVEVDDYQAMFDGAITASDFPLALIRTPGDLVEAFFTAFSRGAAGSSIRMDIQNEGLTSLLSSTVPITRTELAAGGDHVKLTLASSGVRLPEGSSLKIVTTSASGTQPTDWMVAARVRRTWGN